GSVAYTTNGCDSRSESRPSVWSRSPLVSTIASIGEWRGLRGCSPAKPSICWRISGEVLRRTQPSPSEATATDSCVRAVARMLPARTPPQFGHPQFHWGTPPPAADPNTRTRTCQLLAVTAYGKRRSSRHQPGSHIADVLHRLELVRDLHHLPGPRIAEYGRGERQELLGDFILGHGIGGVTSHDRRGFLEHAAVAQREADARGQTIGRARRHLGVCAHLDFLCERTNPWIAERVLLERRDARMAEDE